MQIGQHWNVDESIYYSVHHDQFGVDSMLVEGLLSKVSNHLAGTASGSVVPNDKSCCMPLNCFQCLDVVLGIWIP